MRPELPDDAGPVAPRRHVVVVSTYDLGRQPRALAVVAAALRRAGIEVDLVDTSVGPLPDEVDLVAIHLPMHTASRLAAAVVAHLRQRRPNLTVVGFGLYPELDPNLTAALGLDGVLGADPAAAIAARLGQPAGAGPASPAGLPAGAGGLGRTTRGSAIPLRRSRPEAPDVARSRSTIVPLPDRRGLPALSAYARLRLPDGGERLVGTVEATTGCAHTCRHCPVAAVHGGRFRAVPVDRVLAEVDELVASGAQHVTFADPDFLNGPVHARRVVEGLARRHPGLSYDVTVKVEHLLRHAALLPVLAATGCVLVTSAFESIDDHVLGVLRKGHTAADLDRAIALCRAHHLALAPTWVPFTPWTTRSGFVALLDWIGSRGLVEVTSPVQYGIRLLVTARSLLLGVPEVAAVAGPYDPALLAHPWCHRDPELDALAGQVMATVSAGEAAEAGREAIFRAVRAVASGRSGVAPTFPVDAGPAPAPATVPYLTEPWFC